MGKYRLFVLMFVGFMCLSQAYGADAPSKPAVAIGTVVLSSGKVQRVQAQSHQALSHQAQTPKALHQQAQDLLRGDTVHEGDVLSTGENAYLYIRTVDQAVLILRPESQLRIEVYQFDPKQAQASRVRLQLEKGHMRSVSGQAAKANREGWRLNSPIAAIGLRGTDLSVSTDQDHTRAVVRAGGIVLSPLGGACTRDGFGPCEGATARELAPGLPPMAMMLRRGDAAALVMDVRDVPGAEQLLRVPADERVGLDRKGEALAQAGQSGAGANSAAGSNNAAGSKNAGSTNDGLLGKPLTSSSSMMVNWGRWQDLSAALASKTDRAQALVAYNGYYGLTRDLADQSLPPTKGVFSFRLLGHEGFLIDSGTQRSTPSVVSQASLRIDMDAARFSTKLLLSAADVSAWLESKGSVSQLGLLLAQPGADSNALVQGTLANSGSQAAYIYVRTLDAQRRFVGATSWRK
jgi:hypothetical protein